MTEKGLKYLSDIIQAIELIEDFTQSIKNYSDFVNDLKTQSAVYQSKKMLTLPENGGAEISQNKRIVNVRNISPRTLVVIKYR